MLSLFLSLQMSICADLKHIDLEGSVVREVHRNGQIHTGPADQFKVEEPPYTIPGIEFALRNIESQGGEVLSQVFVSTKGALVAARENKIYNSCLLLYIPVNESEWVASIQVTQVGKDFVLGHMESKAETLVFRKIE